MAVAVAPTGVGFALRLLLATGCGLLIGVERQYRSRTAGLRTNALVAAGACVFVLFGEQAAIPNAPLQIAAYVVSGVGFLGGGVILRQGLAVQGLNTAATLWCSAAIGCQAAAGHLVPALVTTAVVLGIHLFLRPLGRLVDRAPAAKDKTFTACTIHVQARRKQEPRVRAQLLQALTSPSFALRGLTSQPSAEEASGDLTDLHVELIVEGRAAEQLDAIVSRLSLEPGVRSQSWAAEDPGDDEEDDRDDRLVVPRWRLRRHP